MIPIEWEAVNSNDIEYFKYAPGIQTLDKGRVNRRNTAEHALQRGIHSGDFVGRQLYHFRKGVPLRIDLEIPVRLVVRLIPEHHRVYHDKMVECFVASGSSARQRASL